MTAESSTLKRAYLSLVLTATVAAVVLSAAHAPPAHGRAAATILLALELAIRFRYVIALLEWPPSPMRIVLLAGFWVGLVNMARQADDAAAWTVAAAMLFSVGVAIEVHNLVTRQWALGSPAFQRSLRNDILRGIAAATFATIAVLLVGREAPQWAAPFVGLLVAADALRLTEMVMRHRRLLAVPEAL
jgi:hypothetical protein